MPLRSAYLSPVDFLPERGRLMERATGRRFRSSRNSPSSYSVVHTIIIVTLGAKYVLAFQLDHAVSPCAPTQVDEIMHFSFFRAGKGTHLDLLFRCLSLYSLVRWFIWFLTLCSFVTHKTTTSIFHQMSNEAIVWAVHRCTVFKSMKISFFFFIKTERAIR